MDKQSDFVNPKLLEECGSPAHSDDEFEENSEEEMLSEEEPNDEGSSDKESAEEIPLGELNDEDSCAKGSNEEDSEELDEVQEELEEALEEDNEEDASVEEINEEEIGMVLEEKLNGKEALRCSVDQISPVNDSDGAPSLLEEKKASDAVIDAPQVSGKRRRSGWDVKSEDVILVNDSSDLGKKIESRLCAGDSGEESYEEDSDEELEEAFEDCSEDDDSIEESNEKEINKESTTCCSMNQLIPANKPPNLLDEEKVSGNLSAATVVDVPRVSSKRRPSRWDIKAEDLLVNDSGGLGKREIRWSSDIKVKSSTPVKDSSDLNKRKTRWSSDKSQLDMLWSSDKNQLYMPRSPKHRKTKVDKRIEWLKMKLQLVKDNLEHYLTAKANLEKQTSSPEAIDDVRFAKLLEEKDDFVAKISMLREKKKRCKISLFQKLIPLPTKEFSRDNLVGLILGPKGNTIRKMEELTGTRLSLRDKHGFYRTHISNYDEICMMIKANNQESIDAAVDMVEKLLVQKKHIKAAQLKELAKIKGTPKEEKKDFVWTQCDICGDLYHPASGCPLVATDSETVKKFHMGPGNLFSSSGDKEKCETQIMPAKLENCKPPIVNDKKLVVGIADTSQPSPNANLPSYPGVTVVPPSFSNTNLPNYPRFPVPPSTSKANAPPSYSGLAAISPSSNANLPSYPTLHSSSSTSVVPPSSSHANLPNFPRLADTPSNLNVPIFPGHAASLPSSSNASLPNYPRPAPCPPSSMNLNIPNFSRNAPHPTSSSMTNPPNYTGYVAIPPINHGPVVLPSSSSNINLSTRPVSPVDPPTSSKESYPTLTAVPPSSNANLASFTGFVAVPPFSSNANRPSFPGFDSISTPSSNTNLSSYTTFAANLSSSSNANIASYPGFTAASSSSNSNLSSYTELAAIPPPSSAKPQSYPKSTAIPLLSSNGNLSSYTRHAAVPPSTADLPSCTRHTTILQEIPKSNNWPGPPGSSISESSSFLKSGYNLPVKTGSEPLQTSTALGGNAHILDRMKPIPTGNPPSACPNFLKHPEFTATSREIAVPNCWPHPLPESGTSFPQNSSNSLKYNETMPLQSSTLPGSTGQHSTFSSQFPGITAISKELTSFPGYTGLADICQPSLKANLPSYPRLTAISKTSSNANLSSDTGFAAIPWKVPLSSDWPSPPLPLLPESDTSFSRSSYNSPVHTESAHFQSSASLAKNADIFDGKKLNLTVTETPLPPLNPNSQNYSKFAAIPQEIAERNFWPQPDVSIFPGLGTSLPKSINSSLKYSEIKPLPSSAPHSSTGQTTISSSQLPTSVSNELASIPGYPNRIDTSYSFDRPVPSSSLSSQPPHFTGNFSGNQMNPAWRNYNHPASN